MKAGVLAKSPPITISPHDSVRRAAAVMAENRIGFLPIVEGELLVGVVSERDIVRAIAGDVNPDLPVAAIMRREVVAMEYDEDVKKAALLMRTHNIRHIIILKEGKLYGILSIRDIVKEKEIIENIAMSNIEEAFAPAAD